VSNVEKFGKISLLELIITLPELKADPVGIEYGFNREVEVSGELLFSGGDVCESDPPENRESCDLSGSQFTI
jgi:hypothetical protein